MSAARTYINKKAIYHQNFAGNCIELPSEQCFTDGLGPDTFDCMGLVVSAVSDVLDTDTAEFAQKFRHVREIWPAAQAKDTFRTTKLGRGTLLVTRRYYTIGGELTPIPGHIGVVSDVKGDGFDLIQTNTLTGKVEERPIKTLNTIMGYLALAYES